MSLVTNYILAPGRGECNEDMLVSKLNFQIQSLLQKQPGFMRLDPLAGGSKVMESKVFGWAANYCDVTQVAPILIAVGWEDSENLRLFVCHSEGDAFHTYNFNDLLMIAGKNGAGTPNPSGV
jgi:hypothetical protein